MGATATGKTDLAVALAERFPVEIISVDSALIYKDMDIGTAKPESSVLQKAPHFLLDIINPEQSYSVWDFIQDAKPLMDQITSRGNIPLLVGGTMMYFNALEFGINDLPIADREIRKQLEKRAEVSGWPVLHEELAFFDPQAASRIKPSDSQRIQRAIEVFKISGKTLTELQSDETSKLDYDLTKIVLDINDRSLLHQRIEMRFEQMLELGLIEELVDLKKIYQLNLTMTSMRCVGYRQVWQYLNGELSRAEMIDKAIIATRQLAKRQITWLRRQTDYQSFDCLNYTKTDVFNWLSTVLF